MSHLTEIERRHGNDRWKDTLFLVIAVMLIGASVGALTSTSLAAGKPSRGAWTVTVIEGPIELAP